MQLSLKRSFVDDQFNGIFARDLAKSMLRAAIPAANEAAINDLANEIEFPKDMPGYDVARTKPDPKLPSQPSPGYQVFMGQRKSFVQTLSLARVSLENIEGAGGASLLISVTSKALK
jgi:PAB1-binding protein PBP1